MHAIRSGLRLFFLLILLLGAGACSGAAPEPAEPSAPPSTEPPSAPSIEPSVAPTTADATALPVLTDTFDDNRNEWELYEEPGGSVVLEDGRLLMRLRKAELFWTKTKASLSDVDLTFTGSVAEGAPENTAYGAICRYQDSGNYYVFLVSGGGEFGVYKFVEGELQEIAGMQSSPDIKTGEAANRVRIVCSGNNLRLSVNEQSLLDIEDDTFAQGEYMLVTQSFDQGGQPIAAAFDDLEVREPEK